MEKKKLGLSGKTKLELSKTVRGGTVRQSFSHGRVKSVEVEVEADSEWEALSIAEGYAVDINDAWDHAGHTSTQALQADLIEGEA